MAALLLSLAFAGMLSAVLFVEWRATERREGFWTGVLGILAEILSCLLFPY